MLRFIPLLYLATSTGAFGCTCSGITPCHHDNDGSCLAYAHTQSEVDVVCHFQALGVLRLSTTHCREIYTVDARVVQLIVLVEHLTLGTSLPLTSPRAPSPHLTHRSPCVLQASRSSSTDDCSVTPDIGGNDDCGANLVIPQDPMIGDGVITAVRTYSHDDPEGSCPGSTTIDNMVRVGVYARASPSSLVFTMLREYIFPSFPCTTDTEVMTTLGTPLVINAGEYAGIGYLDGSRGRSLKLFCANSPGPTETTTCNHNDDDFTGAITVNNCGLYTIHVVFEVSLASSSPTSTPTSGAPTSLSPQWVHTHTRAHSNWPDKPKKRRQ
jgi:hypothetical protein